MKYELELTSAPVTTFRSTKAANSVDLNLEEKLKHHFSVEADLAAPYSVGLIYGASGSGKTTLATEIFGQDAFKQLLDLSQPIIEQFPADMSYDDCVAVLNGAGLSQVPCWIRPAHTLSNGQRARAEIALQLCSDRETIVVDEFTSVVDRTIAKVMSVTVAKQARRSQKKIVLLSCHYDIAEWLNPDWIIDCNKQEFIDRRSFFQHSNAMSDLPSTLQSASASHGNILASIII